MRAPFNWGDRLQPLCEPRLLSVGDQFFITNLGLTWEITRISHASDTPQGSTSLPSTPYLNNQLQNCQTDAISISLSKSDTAFPATWWVSWASSEVTTSAHCTVLSDSGPSVVAIQTKFSGGQNFDYVINDNSTTHASLWWGTRLLNAYWIGFEAMMALAVASSSDRIYYHRGVFEYRWRETDKKRSVQPPCAWFRRIDKVPALMISISFPFISGSLTTSQKSLTTCPRTRHSSLVCILTRK